MKCFRCEKDMKKVPMMTGIGVPPYLEYTKGILDGIKISNINVWVCPDCGYIELQAENPEQFKNI